jgi:hypothetical protein
MDVLEFLGEAGRFLLRGLIIIAPLLVWQWVALWSRPFRRRAGGLADPTIIAGMMVGFAMLIVIIPPEALDWDAIVDVGGYWDLSLSDFMDLSRGMVLQAPGALWTVVMYDDPRRDLRAWIALAGMLWLIRVAGVWMTSRRLNGPRFLLAELATFAASALGTVYLGPLLLWSINELNFWLALVLVLLIQDYRYDEPPLFGRLVGGVASLHRPRREAPSEIMPMPDRD